LIQTPGVFRTFFFEKLPKKKDEMEFSLLTMILSTMITPQQQIYTEEWRRHSLLQEMVDDLYSYLSQWNRVAILRLLKEYHEYYYPFSFDFLHVSWSANPSIPTLGHWIMEKLLRFVHIRHVLQRFFHRARGRNILI